MKVLFFTNFKLLNEKYSYFDLVYEITRNIPKVKVSTYGAIADYLSLGSARMVGWALNHSHSSVADIPAHRVVNRLGELSGRNHFSDPEFMAKALRSEGVMVADNKIIDFASYFWHPENLDKKQ